MNKSLKGKQFTLLNSSDPKAERETDVYKITLIGPKKTSLIDAYGGHTARMTKE